MAKCKECGAPVNLAPDGDPRYEPPRKPPHPVRHRTSGLVERLEALLSRSTLRHDVEPSVAMTAGERTALREAARILREPSEGREPDVIDVVASVRQRNGRYWVCRRTDDGSHGGLAGMWEFPGGKVEEGETLEEALAREMDEEFGVRVHVGERLERILAQHDEAGKVYAVHFFDVAFLGHPELRVHDRTAWLTPEDLVKTPHLPSGTIFNRLLLRTPSDSPKRPEIGTITGVTPLEVHVSLNDGVDSIDLLHRKVALVASDSPEREGPDAVGLLNSWLSSETQQIRDSFVPHNEKLIPSRVDAHWSANDPDGFALAVATRKYLDRVGFEAPGDGGDTSDENAPPNGEAPHARVTEAPEAARLRNEDNESDAPEPAKSEEPDPGCSECNDWFAPGMGDHAVTAESPECPIRGERCVRYPAAEPAESEETTHQCRDCGWTGSRSDLRDDQLDDGTPLKVCGNLACLSSEIEPYPETGAAPSPEGVGEAEAAIEAEIARIEATGNYLKPENGSAHHNYRGYVSGLSFALALLRVHATRTTEPEPGDGDGRRAPPRDARLARGVGLQG